MADEPPTLTVVADNSPRELERQRLLDDLNWPTREMAANLLRVMRGAGRPSELPQQIVNLSEAILQAATVSNAWDIWDAIETTLQSAIPRRDDESDPYPERTTARGSLQYVASNLLGQSTQMAAGRSEMWDGHDKRQKRIEARQRKWAEEAAQARLQRNAEITRKRNATIAKKKAALARAAAKTAAAHTGEESLEGSRSTADFMKQRQRELSNERGK